LIVFLFVLLDLVYFLFFFSYFFCVVDCFSVVSHVFVAHHTHTDRHHHYASTGMLGEPEE
jgi:bacteriorhodopsin